jgi:predicted Zn finger-like uncharacterized protein
MLIECPGCHETYTVDMPSVAPDGIEIHCKNCNRTFFIRPHGARQSVGNAAGNPPQPPVAPVPEERASPESSSHEAALQTPFDPSMFLQRDEIPYSIVQAYEEPTRIEEPPTSLEEPEDIWSSPEGYEPLETETSDILLDAEELDDPGQLAGLGGDDYFSTPYPLGKDLVVGKKRPKRRLRLWIGLALAAILIVLLALFARRWATQVSFQKIKDVGQGALSLLPWNKLESGKIQISDLNGYFQDRSRKGGPVFVIEGNVTNRYKNPCHSIQVKGILFDERGNPAAEKIVYCGNVLSGQNIKSMSRKKIEQSLQNTYGSTLSNFNIEPGTSVPFMLIFFDPPAKLSEYSLEVHAYTLQEANRR